jgi:hypothetical protein
MFQKTVSGTVNDAPLRSGKKCQRRVTSEPST